MKPDRNGNTRTQREAIIRERERLDRMSRRVLSAMIDEESVTVKGKTDDLLAAIRKGLSNA